MELHYLKLFNALASELNYSRAARLLYISQPALSMQIKKLEEDLGFKLFDKIGKKLYLNDNGKILYSYTERIFGLVEQAQTELNARNGVVKGNVNFGASNTPGTYILPKILGGFAEKFPFVNTNMHIANTHEIEKLIFDNQVDFVINGGHVSYSPSLHVERVMNDKVLFVVSPSSPLAGRSNVEIDELADARYITHEKSSQLFKLAEYMITSELGLPFNVIMTLGHIDAIKQAVAAGLGISVLTMSAVSMELKLGILSQFKLRNKSWNYPYNLVYHKNKNLSTAAEKLIEMIRTSMADMQDSLDK